MERVPLPLVALTASLTSAALMAACSPSPSAAAAPLPSSLAPAARAAPSEPSPSTAHSSAPVASSNTSPSGDELDAGAPPDCTSPGPSKSVVTLPPTDSGMVSNATPDASFDRSHLELGAAIQKRLDRLRCCYDFARKTRPGIEGALVMDFVLHPDGKVREASYNKQKSEMKDDAMGACAAAVWSDITFPPSKRSRPTTVSLPVVFRPGGGAR